MNSKQSAQQENDSPEAIHDIARAFQKSRILLTAYELELFSILEDGGKSSAEVAAVLESDERATDRLMNALCALGFLTKKDGVFSNTDLSRKYLVKESPDYMAGLMHVVHLWYTWSTLTEAVRQGRSVVSRPVNERGENWLGAFIAAMHERAVKRARAVVDLLDLSGVSHVLDVGGGSGAFSMAFVQAREGTVATVFDLPNVIPLTRSYVESAGLSDRIEFVVGDYSVDGLGGGYDLVFLSAIIHSNSSEENQELMRKCAGALNPGGRVVVQDFIMDEDRTTPANGALFALNMLVGTARGDTYTESEVRSWMRDAGLSSIERIETHFGTTLVVGRKGGGGGTS